MKHNKPQYIEIDCFGNTTYFSDKKMTRCHREDDPAVESQDPCKEWWIKRLQKQTININGKEFTVEQLNALIETAKGNKL